jgi:catechol 2,3-dioxygenase-like lactoylglutathione lyase family enzyme
MKIKVTTMYVNDLERAPRFYTEMLGFIEKAAFNNGPHRWLTVTSLDGPEAWFNSRSSSASKHDFSRKWSSV